MLLANIKSTPVLQRIGDLLGFNAISEKEIKLALSFNIWRTDGRILETINSIRAKKGKASLDLSKGETTGKLLEAAQRHLKNLVSQKIVYLEKHKKTEIQNLRHWYERSRSNLDENKSESELSFYRLSSF